MFDELKRRFQDLPKKQVATIAIVVVVFFILLNLNSRISTLFSKQQSVNGLMTEVVNLYATDIVIQTEIAKIEDDDTVETFGRENGYVKPDDVPVALIEQPGEVKPLEPIEAAEDDTRLTLQNWEIWWQLFFGK